MLKTKLDELREKGLINRSFVKEVDELHEGLITDEIPLGGFTEQYSTIYFKEVLAIIKKKVTELLELSPNVSMEDIYTMNIKLLELYERVSNLIDKDKISNEKLRLILEDGGLLTYIEKDGIRTLVDLKDYNAVEALRMDVEALKHMNTSKDISILFEAIKEVPSSDFGIVDLISNNTLHEALVNLTNGTLPGMLLDLHTKSSNMIKRHVEDPLSQGDIDNLNSKLLSVTKKCNFDILKLMILLVTK